MDMDRRVVDGTSSVLDPSVSSSSDPYVVGSCVGRAVGVGQEGEAPPGGPARAGENFPAGSGGAASGGTGSSAGGGSGGGDPPSVVPAPEEDDGDGEDLGFSRPPAVRRFLMGAPRSGRVLRKKELGPRPMYTSRQRLLILRLMESSPLPVETVSEIVGVSPHTLYQWKRIYEAEGIEGLIDRPRGGPKGSRLPEETKQAILMMKEKEPTWGVERISAVLMRDPALRASSSAVLHFLKERGYQVEEEPTVRHPKAPRRFERATPNALWQTDFFDFVLKRQARMVHLITYLDDHSRFVVGYGLHAYATTELALGVLRNAIASYAAPEQVVSDRGPQYANWQGTSDFTRALRSMGIGHILAPAKKHGSTGKVERLWGTIFREFLYRSIFVDLDDARSRIGHFIDHYNFQRPHDELEAGLVPADRYFYAAEEVKRTLKARVAANALEIALHGKPRRLFYITGQVNGRPFSIHEEGGRLVLVKSGGVREEIDFSGPSPSELPTEVVLEVGKQYQAHRDAEQAATGAVPVCPFGSPAAGNDVGNEAPLPPGVSALDGLEERLAQAGRQDAAEVASEEGSVSDRPKADGATAGGAPVEEKP